MDNKYEKLANRFETKLKHLIANYRLLKNENEKLAGEVLKLKNELMQAHKSVIELQEKCNHLRIANSLATTEEEKMMVKDQLGKMVREIDKCIALLTE